MRIPKVFKLAALVAMGVAISKALRPPHEPPADPSGVREPRVPFAPSGSEGTTL